MIKFIIDWVDLFLFRRQWRKHNSHNETVPVRKFDIHKVIVGKYTYGLLDVSDWSTNGGLRIGSYCSIAPHVIFLIGSEHPTGYISTFPFKTKMFRQSIKAKLLLKTMCGWV
jgi:acetyltransferase-like isoleucine patch superfamily enzyme